MGARREGYPVEPTGRTPRRPSAFIGGRIAAPDAAKAQVREAGVLRGGHPRRGAGSSRSSCRCRGRTPPLDPADLGVGRPGVDALRGADGIHRHIAGRGPPRVGPGIEEVRAPLPDVPGHVVQPEAVGGEAPHRGRPGKPSAALFASGNEPVQMLQRSGARGSLPHAKGAPSSPPRAANSHSASVGSRLPAHAAKAAASS